MRGCLSCGGRRRAGEKDEAAAGTQVAVGGGGRGGIAPADRVKEPITARYETTRLDHPVTQKFFSLHLDSLIRVIK